MRADRLVAALLLLQARGRVTAAELADELEVSVATARRDLEALSTAGIPVYPQPGGAGLVAARRRPHRPERAHRRRGPGAVRPGGAGRGGARRPGRRCASWCGPCPGRSGPRPRRGPAVVVVDPAGWGERRRPPAAAGRRPAGGGRRRGAGCAWTTPAGPRAVPPGGRPVGPGRQGRRLVPGGGHRTPARTFSRAGGGGGGEGEAATRPAGAGLRGWGGGVLEGGGERRSRVSARSWRRRGWYPSWPAARAPLPRRGAGRPGLDPATGGGPPPPAWPSSSPASAGRSRSQARRSPGRAGPGSAPSTGATGPDRPGWAPQVAPPTLADRAGRLPYRGIAIRAGPGGRRLRGRRGRRGLAHGRTRPGDRGPGRPAGGGRRPLRRCLLRLPAPTSGHRPVRPLGGLRARPPPRRRLPRLPPSSVSPQHHWDFGDMPPVTGLDEAQIQGAVIAYVRHVQELEGFEAYPP